MAHFYQELEVMSRRFHAETAEPDEADEIYQFLENNLLFTAPTRQLCQMDDPEQGSIMKRLVKKKTEASIDEGVSFTIRDSSSNQLAAVAINYIVNIECDAIQGWFSEDDPYAVLCDLLIALYGDVDVFQTYGTDSVFMIAMIAVSPEHARLGLGRKLIELSVDIARKSGAKVVAAEALSEYAAKAFTKCGFQTLRTIQYASIDCKNGRIYEGIDCLQSEHPNGRLMARSIAR